MAVKVHAMLARDVFATYGYFVVDDDTGSGFLVDPGAQPELFLREVGKNGWDIEAILLTHGHFDHTGAVRALRGELNVPVMAHELSDRYLLDPVLNLSAEHGRCVVVPDTVKFGDGDRIALSGGSVALDVAHVPGHTDDSCAFLCEGAGFALVGDTVYGGGPGLTVFPTGNARVLRESIRSKFLALPGDTLLLSGHSRAMTVGQLALAVG